MNGTFYNKDTGIISSVAIADGQILHSNGGYNSADPTGTKKQGTYSQLISSVNGILCFSDLVGIYDGHVYNNTIMTIENCKFAVGGVSLYPADESLVSANDYYAAISNEGEDQSYVPSQYVPRSAIVYIGGNLHDGLNTVLLTVTADPGTVVYNNNNGYLVRGERTDGVSLWELREIVNGYFGAMLSTPSTHVYHAIALDGGSSVSITYKNNDGVRESYAMEAGEKGWAKSLTSVLTVPDVEFVGYVT